ncbi:MAG TPA: hypothetical protein VGR62_18410 [Candidatus Binatia bacterium]|jgi:hypothetical protein|nr:hypothetical protein [Candidatus Binatia bacterium]
MIQLRPIVMLALVTLLAQPILGGTASGGSLLCGDSTAPECGGSCPSGESCGVARGAPGCECAPLIVTPLAIGKLAIKLNFSTPAKDSVTLTGTLPIPDGFDPTAKVLGLDIGGVVRSFTLDAKGKAQTATDKVTLTVRASRGIVLAQDAKFTVKISKGSLAGEFTDEGLTDADVDKEPRSVDVQVTVEDASRSAKTAVLTYKAKQGKTGSASGK